MPKGTNWGILQLLLPLVTITMSARAAEITLKDSQRGREIPVKIYSPAKPGQYPLIVFSHGAGGSNHGYEFVAKHWSTEGYVVALPTHSGSDTKALPQGVIRAIMKIKEMVEDVEQLRNRPADIHYVLEHLPELEKALKPRGVTIDTQRIGMGGHSFGAYTTMVIAGATTRQLPEGAASPVPKAFLAMSPQNEGQMGFEKDSWNRVTRPVLLLTGTEDKGLGGEPVKWRMELLEHLPPGKKTLVVLEGADHMTFAGTDLRGNKKKAFEDQILKITTAFWNSELKSPTTDFSAGTIQAMNLPKIAVAKSR